MNTSNNTKYKSSNNNNTSATSWSLGRGHVKTAATEGGTATEGDALGAPSLGQLKVCAGADSEFWWEPGLEVYIKIMNIEPLKRHLNKTTVNRYQGGEKVRTAEEIRRYEDELPSKPEAMNRHES